MKKICCTECGRPFEPIAGVTMDRGLHTVRREGFQSAAVLTSKEFAIFEAILARGGRPVNHYAIFDDVYSLLPECDQPDPEIVKVFMIRIRVKLALLGIRIVNVYGHGYGLEFEDRPIERPTRQIRKPTLKSVHMEAA